MKKFRPEDLTISSIFHDSDFCIDESEEGKEIVKRFSRYDMPSELESDIYSYAGISLQEGFNAGFRAAMNLMIDCRRTEK